MLFTYRSTCLKVIICQTVFYICKKRKKSAQHSKQWPWVVYWYLFFEIKKCPHRVGTSVDSLDLAAVSSCFSHFRPWQHIWKFPAHSTSIFKSPSGIYAKSARKLWIWFTVIGQPTHKSVTAGCEFWNFKVKSVLYDLKFSILTYNVTIL